MWGVLLSTADSKHFGLFSPQYREFTTIFTTAVPDIFGKNWK